MKLNNHSATIVEITNATEKEDSVCITIQMDRYPREFYVLRLNNKEAKHFFHLINDDIEYLSSLQPKKEKENNMSTSTHRYLIRFTILPGTMHLLETNSLETAHLIARMLVTADTETKITSLKIFDGLREIPILRTLLF